jgi:hypothetical protein
MSKQIMIKEPLNVSIARFDNGDPLCYVDYASDASIATTSERLDLRGGQGNYKLGSFDHTKDCTFTLEMPLVDMSFLAMLTGKPVDIGAIDLPKRQILTASASNTVTLASTPVSGTLEVYLLDGDRDYGTEQVAGTPASVENTYSITGTVITLNATTAPSGTKIVVKYKYAAPATTRTTYFTADKFPIYVTIDGFGKATDQVTGVEEETVFVIKKGKPKPNFTITQKATEATMLTMEFDLFTVDEDVDGDGEIDKIYLSMSELV